MKKRTFLFLLFLLLGMSFLATPVMAQEQLPSDDEVNAIASQLYCPVCENVPLDVCPTQACAQWRETIRERLIAGENEQEIKDFFVEQYGARVLATPPATGFNWLVYVLPPAVFLVGAFVLVRTFRNWRKTPPIVVPEEVQGQDAASQDPYVQRIEAELRRRMES
jgi:cytochrome c-type biogenesis protein CcmH